MGMKKIEARKPQSGRDVLQVVWQYHNLLESGRTEKELSCKVEVLSYQ